MHYLLMNGTPTGDIVAIFIICLGISAMSAVLCWKGWGIDLHEHLERQGTAYDVLHPEDRAEQEQRAQAPS